MDHTAILSAQREQSLNKQLFDAGVHGLDVVFDKNAPDFSGAKQPNLVVQTETPKHRQIAYLRAQGLGIGQIFQQLGGEIQNGKPVSGTGEFSYAWISQLCRQPWFRERVASIINDNGGDFVKKTLEAVTMDALNVQIDLLTSDDEKIRLQASESLLNRHLGKATQRTEVTVQNQTISQKADELERIEKELKRYESLTGSIPE